MQASPGQRINRVISGLLRGGMAVVGVLCVTVTMFAVDRCMSVMRMRLVACGSGTAVRLTR